jgi:hypothetical protein
MNPLTIFLFLLALPLACFSQASQEPLDLAGFIPGQSPRAAASAFSHQQLPWSLSSPADASLSDALGNDCIKNPPSTFWVCKVTFSGPPFGSEAQASSTTKLTLSYDAPPGTSALRQLVHAQLFTQFNDPQAFGWPAFLEARRAPRAKGLVLVAQAKKLFAARGFELPDEAKSFQGAFWIYPSSTGDACELSALAALDAKGSLIALLAENSLGQSSLTRQAMLGKTPASPTP